MGTGLPVGQRDEVHFNTHRVFNANTIFEHPSIKQCMKLIRFDYVDDDGDLHLNSRVVDIKAEIKFGCGIYTFEKVNPIEWMVRKSKMI